MGYVPEPANAPKLRLIHFNVAGTDHVMKKAAFQDPKITITNSTGGPSPAVAEWVVGTMIGHLRQLFVFKEWQKAKTWAKLDMKSPPVNLDGKKLAILGYGSIGRQS
jgi:phosphoglycerate dehydrogenase-like enzyme